MFISLAVFTVALSAACGGDSSSSRTTIPTGSSETTIVRSTTSMSQSTASPADLPTTTAQSQSASTAPRATTQAPPTSAGATTTTLPGSISASPSMNQVLILSTGPGPLFLGTISEISGSGLTVDTSDCGATMPAGNVCVVRFNTAGVPSGTINARLRIESNASSSPDIVDVTVVVP